MTLRSRISMLQWHWHNVPQKAVMWVAWRLPRSIAYWAAIRVMANATTGAHENQVVPDLTAMEALERWEATR